MSAPVFHALQKVLALACPPPGAQRCGKYPLSRSRARMAGQRIGVGIRGTAVNQRLELRRNIAPIGRHRKQDRVVSFHPVQQFLHTIRWKNAPPRLVTLFASSAKRDALLAQTDAFRFVLLLQRLLHPLQNLPGRAVLLRACVYHQDPHRLFSSCAFTPSGRIPRFL